MRHFLHHRRATCKTSCHSLLCSVGADPEHRGGGEQEDRRGGVSVLQAGSQLPWRESETTRDPAVPLPLLPRRAQEQQGPGNRFSVVVVDCPLRASPQVLDLFLSQLKRVKSSTTQWILKYWQLWDLSATMQIVRPFIWALYHPVFRKSTLYHHLV